MEDKDYIVKEYWEAVVNLMDDDIREQVHNELAPCTEVDFMKRYLELDPDFEDLVRTEFGEERAAALLFE